MNTRLILTTAAGAILWLPAAQAGSRSFGTGTAAAVSIPADTISSGGGQSSAGSGASAVTITASMGGVIGTVSAAPATTVQQGYIPQILPPRLYEIWAAANIPAGRDATFTGDWNGDGISNGIAYVFGNTPVSPVGNQPAGTGRIPVPPAIPADVNVYLELSERTLSDWKSIVSWVNGAAPTFRYPLATSIVGGQVVDKGFPAWASFYRYRVVRR